MTTVRGGRSVPGPPGRRKQRPGGPEPPIGAGARPSPEMPPPPKPLAVAVTDTHTHLDMQDTDVDDAIVAAAAVGVTTLVQVGVDVPSSVWAADLAAVQPAVWATVALHPNEAPRVVHGDNVQGGWSGRRRPPGGPEALDEALSEIDRLAALPQVRGVGETGLDYFRTDESGRGAQLSSFRRHIEIAKRHGKALVIHDRDAHDDVLRVLEEDQPPDRVVFHCYSGDAGMAKQCAERGYYMSFAGNVTFASAQPLRDALSVAPMQLLLVETDAPFLTPVPHRGRPNAPYLVPLTVRKMAEVKSVDEHAMAAALAANAERVFGPYDQR